MGDGRSCLKISAPHSLMTTYRINLISAGSISLDNIFNVCENETDKDDEYRTENNTKIQVHQQFFLSDLASYGESVIYPFPVF
jgi:hypothetical protein